MLTANEIRNIRFTKSMGGYKMLEVDDFIDRCADTVAALTNAKIELEKKLEVLADKLVEYRNDEDNIRTALLSAQRLGDTVVREAKHKAGLILDDAKIKAEKVQENAQRSIKDEERELERIRREITNFKARMLSIYREHLALIDVLPELRDEDEKQKQEPVESSETASVQQIDAPEAAEAAGQVIEPTFEPVEESSAAQPEVAPVIPGVMIDIPELQDEDTAAAPLESPAVRVAVPTSRFGDLKFGDSYDIAKDDSESAGFFKRRK